MTDFNHLLSKVEEMKKQRIFLEQQLRDALMKDDITTDLVTMKKKEDVQVISIIIKNNNYFSFYTVLVMITGCSHIREFRGKNKESHKHFKKLGEMILLLMYLKLCFLHQKVNLSKKVMFSTFNYNCLV